MQDKDQAAQPHVARADIFSLGKDESHISNRRDQGRGTVEIAFASPSSARLNAEEAGWLLGFTKEEITSLWPRRFSSLSEIQASNGRKSFSAAEVLRLGETSAWIDKATKAVIHYWWVRNHGEPTNHVQR